MRDFVTIKYKEEYMVYAVEVEISTKDGVLNPESKAILHALQTHDFAVSNLVMNKKFYFTLESPTQQEAEETVKSLCEDFLANSIIQNYSIVITKV